MQWVYILKCSDDYYYVGETNRLYRRFWEHQEGIGGLNTSTYIPECIVSIYKIKTLSFFVFGTFCFIGRMYGTFKV